MINSQTNWRTTFNLTVFAAYFYAFMEWLFFVTKPSSLSILTLAEKLQVLIVTGGITALLLLAGLILFSLPSWLSKNPRWQILRTIPSAFILAITALLLFDNFTYTLFKFGTTSTGGIFRALYGLGLIIIFWRMMQFTQWTQIPNWKFASILTICLLTLSMAATLSENLSNNPYTNSDTSTSSKNRPNIIIIGGDGLNANYMSAYGYSQNTTPFLAELAETSFVAENAFVNASSTTASTTSVLTGKEPVSLNVLRYPDILSGNDSFEHLPGILKRQGYQTVEIGVPYYVDAQKLNLLDGFDIVNNQSVDLPVLNILRKVIGNSPSAYFIQTIAERASERLFHIFFLEETQNPLKAVTSPKSRMSDAERTAQIIQKMDETERPLFIFAHYMDTHGPEFSSPYEIFSGEPVREGDEWDINEYKNALLSFDENVKEVYEYLEDSGKLDNTLLLIYTDHGYRYAVHQRVPLIIHFPEESFSGSYYNNVQVMDIPVTLLDYLDISIPDWMVGISMLNDKHPEDREIISIISGSPKKSGPPFYQIKIVQVVICHRWYALNVQENEWKSGVVSRHTTKDGTRCNVTPFPTDEHVRQRILDYLAGYGYDISSLE
ncbi:MAG TPA: sulfatase-like hydrolase/transferase [Anaerolineales bacterium]|nr:sulfatase-like hydrolase/transferase [Anaerolineales bacterium]